MEMCAHQPCDRYAGADGFCSVHSGSSGANSHEARLDRIEAKLDALIAALAEDEEDQPTRTLDGDESGGERDQTQGL